MKLDDLRALYIEQMQDLYSAETQLIEALPLMAKAAKSKQLKSAFETHLTQTQEHVRRLEQIFERMGEKAKGKKCKGMEGLIKEGNEMIKEDADPDVLDAGLIAAANRIEHYEIAGYGTVRTYAQMLGENEAARILQTTLDEEGQTDQQLTALAETKINIRAQS
jgi:ferritin-like metal-binding protein YciE